MLLRVLILLVLSLTAFPAFAQDADDPSKVQTRLGANFKKKLSKEWDAWVNPEFRFDNTEPDRFLLEIGATYEPIKYLAVKAGLRGDINDTSEGLGYGLRPGISAKGKLPMGDFEGGLRLYYTFDFGQYRDDEHRLRYQGSLKYNVPGIRLNLQAAIEAFQRLNEGWIFKLRYGIEADYKFYKSKKLDQFVYAGYALDQYFDRNLITHIPQLGYKLNF